MHASLPGRSVYVQVGMPHNWMHMHVVPGLRGCGQHEVLQGKQVEALCPATERPLFG